MTTRTTSSPGSRRTAGSLAKARVLATGEPHQLAVAEVTAHGAPVPGPAHGEQELWEARVLAALLAAYGSHRPAETGGPYGISRVTPRPGETLLHVDRAQLGRWASALLPVQRADGTLTGVAGLRWSAGTKDVALHPAGAPDHRIVLAKVFTRDWKRAVADAVEVGDVLLAGDSERAGTPGPREEAADRAQRERVAPCAGDLSALLRRVVLLELLAKRHFHGGAVELAVDSGRLIDLTGGRARLTLPWVTVHLFRELWPGRPARARTSATAAVLPFLASYPSPPGTERPGTAQQGLCVLAGIEATEVAVRAAGWALEVADAELADPRTTYLDDEGGWTANRRRAAEGGFGESGPLDPPGCARALDGFPGDFAELGRLAFLPAVFHEVARDFRPDEEQLTEEGRQILIRLLDWALAAATHRVTTRGPWQQSDPADGAALSSERTPLARWIAAKPLPDSPVPLQLRVNQRSDGNFGYAVHPGPDGVPEWVHHATPALRFGSADSLPAAMALAEQAGREVAAGARSVRSFDRRLLIPRPVPADADPQVAELIAATGPGEMVLDLYELTAGLRALAGLDGQSEPYLYNPPADGHWRQGETWPEAGTVSALLGEDHVLAATRPGEDANTAPVDSPAYRRHLAGQAIAIDPLAEVYLTAADAVPGLAPLRERHRAGVAALQAADIAALVREDPRPTHPGEDIAAIVRDLPADVQRVEDFFEGWFHQREGGGRR
ncbi:hypothetical protein ABT095_14230 [Kitasatospora sp. NPDC002227]|uniref:hypothetical protein n=1 Tax=Kitasatospora sp. NPDC002227 TaxID=3154773 RepID=UPI003333CDC9